MNLEQAQLREFAARYAAAPMDLIGSQAARREVRG
jgi:hypothetical protein